MPWIIFCVGLVGLVLDQLGTDIKGRKVKVITMMNVRKGSVILLLGCCVQKLKVGTTHEIFGRSKQLLRETFSIQTFTRF